MIHKCKLCSKSFTSEHAAMPYSEVSKNIYVEAHKHLDDMPDRPYGADGFTPVCMDCFTKLAEAYPWLLEAFKEKE